MQRSATAEAAADDTTTETASPRLAASTWQRSAPQVLVASAKPKAKASATAEAVVLMSAEARAQTLPLLPLPPAVSHARTTSARADANASASPCIPHGGHTGAGMRHVVASPCRGHTGALLHKN